MKPKVTYAGYLKMVFSIKERKKIMYLVLENAKLPNEEKDVLVSESIKARYKLSDTILDFIVPELAFIFSFIIFAFVFIGEIYLAMGCVFILSFVIFFKQLKNEMLYELDVLIEKLNEYIP